MGAELVYRDDATASNLVPGEFAIYRNGDDSHAWLMAFCFVRTTDQQTETRVIPINPGGDRGGGPDPRSWGLRQCYRADRWQVSPSIKCSDYDPEDPKKSIEVWHETPELIGVPHTAPWVQWVAERRMAE